jgi:hypothetical protein
VSHVALPVQEAIRDITTDLFGRGTAADKSSDPIEPEDVGAVATYRDDDGKLGAVAVADKDLVGIFGGALAMVPQVALQEAKRSGRLPENIYENFWEVANILVSLLNRPNSPHLVLADRYRTREEATDEVREVIEKPTKRRHFAITVMGYGTGRISLFAA